MEKLINSDLVGIVMEKTRELKNAISICQKYSVNSEIWRKYAEMLLRSKGEEEKIIDQINEYTKKIEEKINREDDKDKRNVLLTVSYNNIAFAETEFLAVLAERDDLIDEMNIHFKEE